MTMPTLSKRAFAAWAKLLQSQRRRAVLSPSDDDANTFKARLRGLGEAPPVATQASGSFTATLSSDGTTLNYTVTYANLNAQ